MKILLKSTLILALLAFSAVAQGTDPPQPQGQGQYSISALIPSAIKTFSNQADYFAKTGKTAPQYNPALPIKAWIDTSAPAGFAMLTYNTAHLDANGQKPVVTTISMPSFLASAVNLPPDSGPIPHSTAGTYLTPIRALLPNEQLVASPFSPNGIGGVVNLDLYNPNPPASAPPTGGFTDADRSLLKAIAAAIGIKQ